MGNEAKQKLDHVLFYQRLAKAEEDFSKMLTTFL